jgi:hypothetical protein
LQRKLVAIPHLFSYAAPRLALAERPSCPIVARRRPATNRRANLCPTKLVRAATYTKAGFVAQPTPAEVPERLAAPGASSVDVCRWLPDWYHSTQTLGGKPRAALTQGAVRGILPLRDPDHTRLCAAALCPGAVDGPLGNSVGATGWSVDPVEPRSGARPVGGCGPPLANCSPPPTRGAAGLTVARGR